MIIGVSDGEGNCTFGDVKMLSFFSSCVTGGKLWNGGGVFIITFGCIGTCGAAIICNFVYCVPIYIWEWLKGKLVDCQEYLPWKSC